MKTFLSRSSHISLLLFCFSPSLSSLNAATREGAHDRSCAEEASQEFFCTEKSDVSQTPTIRRRKRSYNTMKEEEEESVSPFLTPLRRSPTTPDKQASERIFEEFGRAKSDRDRVLSPILEVSETSFLLSEIDVDRSLPSEEVALDRGIDEETSRSNVPSPYEVSRLPAPRSPGVSDAVSFPSLSVRNDTEISSLASDLSTPEPSEQPEMLLKSNDTEVYSSSPEVSESSEQALKSTEEEASPISCMLESRKRARYNTYGTPCIPGVEYVEFDTQALRTSFSRLHIEGQVATSSTEKPKKVKEKRSSLGRSGQNLIQVLNFGSSSESIVKDYEEKKEAETKSTVENTVESDESLLSTFLSDESVGSFFKEEMSDHTP